MAPPHWTVWLSMVELIANVVLLLSRHCPFQRTLPSHVSASQHQPASNQPANRQEHMHPRNRLMMSVPPRRSSPQLFAFNFFQTPSSTREALQAEAYFWPEIRPRKWDIFYVDFSSFCIAVVRAIRTGHHLQFHFLCALATCYERQLAQISKNLPSTIQVYLVVVETLRECPKQHRKK